MRNRSLAAVSLVAAVAIAPPLAASVRASTEPGDPGAATEPSVAAADWVVADPADHGMDAAALEAAREYAFTEDRNTQGVVVIRGGELVAEWYEPESGPDSWAASWSMAKSVTSALIGIAIDDGLIPSVDEPMATYFPEFADGAREEITIRHVLHMTSGLDWIEDYDPEAIGESDIVQMVLDELDQLAYSASIAALHDPATTFNYSSGDTMLLSGVLEQATGMPVADYAERELFGPIGIDQAEWWEDGHGHTLTYCCLDMPTRDFARFGQLYLDGGSRDGKQVVPAEWVAESVASSPREDGYGHQWWLTGITDDALPDDVFSARGHDGQYLYVIPSLDLVVVRNSLYFKHDGPAIADPNLFALYPNSLVAGEGTDGSEIGWSDADFLTPIIDSIESD